MNEQDSINLHSVSQTSRRVISLDEAYGEIRIAKILDSPTISRYT